jgi:hypothetical protein
MKTFVLVLFFGGRLVAIDMVEEIACNVFVDTVPYSEVLQLPKSPDPLAKLFAILEANSKQKCWSNSVWMIGVLGDYKQTSYLIALMSRETDGSTVPNGTRSLARFWLSACLPTRAAIKSYPILKI